MGESTGHRLGNTASTNEKTLRKYRYSWGFYGNSKPCDEKNTYPLATFNEILDAARFGKFFTKSPSAEVLKIVEKIGNWSFISSRDYPEIHMAQSKQKKNITER